jgi:hypothetical protein
MDGRGGWQLSQINTDRWISDYDDYYLAFCFAVLATDAQADDFVEATRLTASMGDNVIGTSEYVWKHPNAMWQAMDGQAIFEWPQRIDLTPEADGLITIEIEAKIHSQTEWLTVYGSGFARIKKVDCMAQLDWRWAGPLAFSFVRLIPRRFRRSRSEC